MLAFAPTLGLLLLTGVRAGPITPFSLQRRATSLPLDQLNAIIPFAQFARAAYCPPSEIQGWQCGQACDALPGFNATLTGGDGDAIQFFFVGFWPQGNTVVVAHQGTDPTQLESDLTDIDILTGPLDPTLFPGAPNVLVHAGFRDEHAKTADAIFTEVQSLLDSTGSTSVTTIGHSLGGALSVLESLSLRLRLPQNIAISARTFGTPRVGDPDFAQFYDTQVSDIQRVNNEQDLIPIVPGRFLGFEHPQGEIHILSAGNAVACAGDDNDTDAQCTDQSVPTILEGDILNHLGPYQGVYIGTIFCT